MADLGTLIPIAAALVLVNGIDPVAAFGVAGIAFVVAGFVYRLPMPVQPIKAAAAIAIATGASSSVVAAAGLLIGSVLVALGVLRRGRLLAKLFPKPLIRGNQLGVGLLLVVAAWSLAGHGELRGVLPYIVAGGAVAMLALLSGRTVPAGLVLVAGGVVWTLVTGGAGDLGAAPALPQVRIPSLHDASIALTLLVIPQLPLTLGNAVVGTAELARDYFGASAGRVTEDRLCLTSGLANLAAGSLGGMPLCHGSSGMTAYHRLGATGAGVNLVVGTGLLAVGLLLGSSATAALALIPGPVLAALLAYTGIRHALLVRDLRGRSLAVALAMGLAGGLTRNLSIGMAVGAGALALGGLARRFRGRARRRPRLYSP